LIDPGSATSNYRSCPFAGNSSLAFGAISCFQESEFLPWDLHYTILIEYELVLGTRSLDLGAVALLRPYFWILEPIFSHLHQTCAQICVIRLLQELAITPGAALEVSGGDEIVNRNMTLVPRGESTRPVRDIHEVYRMFGEMICGTHMVHMGSPEREEACSFCFLALRLVSRVN
jgi:hypothetical protein